ncbi:MAG: (2Fe-2S)-binding protein [Acidimicrobiales bacterium]
MLICHCKALNERAIRAWILAGARSTDALAERCGAGATCGGCTAALEELLDRMAAEPDRATVIPMRRPA